ncbi:MULTISPECIES: YqeG family HAD IIIA-type phosphatase [Thermoanaerobacterium]|uniref:HAD superfamily phosphatase (TIGR01668 family) n=1 Tax=Thermoanaerobacterium butyriciformans TaxID=1702242 RepID=A0ABS4NHF0_9THEO|nr:MULTISPECIES: YqeG family HAD IIIA-type phosphatase [Thermoanaerobacterium]MBP2073091.1 HAD superfamily phosphatase (TIGR01668 family) [Thermoanaerobacterium butyriciformans]WHE08004.1 YqeG family HAD IIIA-type phosphatase [Thermoanaerobacterium thermosaccharolyticum]WKV08962.1 YqeG family HAD IIIA-type phosphatase [Thermoanaerobacterium sp. CMT5567-10]
MYKKLIPDMYVNSIYDINFEELKERGITSLVFDIDNTLVPQKILNPDRKVINLFKFLKSKGFKICLISNNTTKRVNNFTKNIGIQGVSWAIKPRKAAFYKALKMLDSKPEETAIIGDQIFTDILGGHRVGLFTILVRPLSSEEFGWTKLMRKLERRVLKKV